MKLFKFQEPIFEQSKDKKSFALFMEMGTGKTIVSIETIIHLYNQKQINFAIIIATKMVCESVWEYELNKFRDKLNYRLFKWIGDVSSTDKQVILAILKDIIQEGTITDSTLPILLVNLEAFSHGIKINKQKQVTHVPGKVYDFVSSILSVTQSIVIIDESAHIKGVKAIRTIGLLSISVKPKYKRILSGAPVLRSPEDLYTQIRFLGANLIPYMSYYSFRGDFCNVRSVGRYEMVVGHKNLDKLAELIKPFSIRVTKKDCFDLPEKIHVKRYIEMLPAQKRLYDQMKNEGYAELKSCNRTVFASTFLAQLSKLHQIANGLLIQEGLYMESLKYSAIMEILETEASGQSAIWFWFVDTLKRVEELVNKKFGQGSCVSIYGDIGHNDRVERLVRFQKERARFLLASPGTLMEGINLTCCNSVQYFNNSTHLAHRIQSEDRFHRIGQVNKVTYTDIVAYGTVEDKILVNLQRNHEIGASILGDEWQEWFA